MPGIVKIGLTTREKIEDRLRELFNTSIPVPFKCEFACKVEDCNAVENALHIAFNPNRIHPQREFFKIEPEQAIAILTLLKKDDITPELNKEINEITSKTDRDAGEKLERQRSPVLNFTEMKIPIGSQLTFLKDNSIKVEVVGEKKIKYRNNIMSLTPATREILGLDYNVQPTRFWSYNGKNLNDIYMETYSSYYL